MTKINIPPGLIDENIEMFKTPGKMMVVYNGAVKALFEMPTWFLDMLRNEMYSNPSVVAALEMAGYSTENEQLEKFADCRFGGFDFIADFQNNKLSETEYHECGFRGDCPMEGIVCTFFKVNGNIITPFEIEIIKLLATEDKLPVIAKKLKISMNNFESKKQVLFKKLKVLSRSRLVALCYDIQLLTPIICSENYQLKE